jgi:hypothetical protein
MPSPFPGMDPYLEGGLWTTFHFAFGAEIVRQLAPRLRPRYLVLPVEREMAVPHVSLEIRDTANRQLVTAIEILSPINKRADGRMEYLAKRRQILLSTTHLLEIDLLRHGRRLPMRDPLPPTDYFILLSRAESRPISDVWPLALPDPLPAVPIPLLSGDTDVALDLQQTFTATYDLLGYDLVIDYRRPPEPPLVDQASALADSFLHTAGLRLA